MTNDFRSYDYKQMWTTFKNENHWSLLITRYSLLITRNTNTPQRMSEIQSDEIRIALNFGLP